MKSIKSQDYYEILGVSRLASQDDIRRAYDLCKHTYRDDSLAIYSLFSEEESKEMFSQMSRAYEILNDPSSRQEYDSYLSQKEGKGAPDNEGERMVASMIGVGRESRPEPASSPAQAGGKERHQAGKKRKAPAKNAPPASTQDGPDTENRVEKLLESVDKITGPVLKKIRTAIGISLEEMSDQTKIRQTYLRYLEDEEYEFLPAPVYIKGFVNNIATVLGLPPQRAAEEYMDQFNAHHDGK